jgi:hypothetical protein
LALRGQFLQECNLGIAVDQIPGLASEGEVTVAEIRIRFVLTSDEELTLAEPQTVYIPALTLDGELTLTELQIDCWTNFLWGANCG